MSLALVETNLIALFANSAHPELPTRLRSNGHIRTQALRHFQETASLTLGSTSVTKVMSSYVPQIAWSSPYLMHVVLAVSCAHQKRLSLNEMTSQTYGYVEAEHWSHGLRSFREHLGKPDSNKGALVASIILIICYTFALDDELSPDAIFQTDESSYNRILDPLAATAGFRALSSITTEMEQVSIWAPILCSTDDEQHSFTSERPGVRGVPRAFVELCELNEMSNPTNNPYHRIIRHLTPLFSLEPSAENFPTLFAFCGRTWHNFKPLLAEKDPRALLLIAYWFALIRQIDRWWLSTRVKTACRVITNYLKTVQNPKIHAMLSFPASIDSIDANKMRQLLASIACDTC